MTQKYYHGGGYREAAKKAALDLELIKDYSTTINWKATEFFPDITDFDLKRITEYPDINYSKLKQLISNIYNIENKDFTITNGANEGIANIFKYLYFQNYHCSKNVVFVDSIYAEYYKYAGLYNFQKAQIGSINNTYDFEKLTNQIVIFVNPNTPSGYCSNLEELAKLLLANNNIIIIDESFLDYTNMPSVLNLIQKYPDLYIIKSLTKFYGSPGGRLGLIINNNIINSSLDKMIPPWSISAFDNWFYITQIPKHNLIKANTLKWIEEESNKLRSLLKNLTNITLYNVSKTSYHTLEISKEFLKDKKIKDIQEYFLKQYNIYIRPTKDFYGYSETSFRVGLRLAEDNKPLWNALQETG